MSNRLANWGVALTLMLVAGAAQAAPISSVGSGFWTNPASWNPAQVPGINNDVTITNGCTNTISTNVALAIASLTIQTNGVLTHLANGTTLQGERYKVILNIAGNLTIDAGGQINADGVGYGVDGGPGAGATQIGASHGGKGGSTGTSPGPTYGSITDPTNLGSGGTSSFGGGGSGGGAVRLSVGLTATVNGVISASAGPGQYYGASGGSIFLTTGALTGNGTLRANGGAMVNNTPGGGGRIAVVLTNSADFSNVKMQAYTGSGTGNPGAGGTVYLQNTNHAPNQGRLVVDYNDLGPGGTVVNTLQNGKDVSVYAFSEIVLTNGAVYALDTNDTLDITSAVIYGDSADRNDGLYVNGGTLTVPAAFAWSNCFIRIGATNSTFNPVTSLTVDTNATLQIDVPWILNCPVTVAGGGILNHSGNITNYPAKTNLTINGNLNIQAGGGAIATVIVVNGNLTIYSNGVLTHVANSTTALGELYKLILTVASNLTIDLGGQINVTGNGYARNGGPGTPPGAPRAGASHGGEGAVETAPLAKGATYGSVTAPTNLGSGAGATFATSTGGGAVRLYVAGTSTVNGVISADGIGPFFGGSGGSVFLTAGALAGNGTISANGGSGNGYAGGGGGRIAIILTNSTDFGAIQMQAYSAGSSANGAPGTVYLQNSTQGAGQGLFVIDASNMATTVTTLINSNVTDTIVGTVIITNKAILAIDTNQSLTVNGSWLKGTNTSFIANSNSTVIFADTNTATIAGSNAFCNLTITNAGKIVSFQAGKTNTVAGLLKLGSTTPGSTVTLKSTADSNWWYLALTSAGTQQIARVDVKDSNASGGQQLLAGRGSVNRGNNVNWFFPKIPGTILTIW